MPGNRRSGEDWIKPDERKHYGGAVRAYADLAIEGTIVSRAGGGSVIAARDRSTPAYSPPRTRDRLKRGVRYLVAYSLTLGYAPAELIHAVRAELTALGHADAAQADRPMEIRPTLPVHALPADAKVLTSTGDIDIGGLVARPQRLDRHDLQKLPRATLEQPFACDEGWVAWSLRWSGVRLRDVLALAELLPNAACVRVGAGTYCMPVSLRVESTAILADELDGEPLAVEHGAPWRLIVPGAACYTSVKWVDRLDIIGELVPPHAPRV